MRDAGANSLRAFLAIAFAAWCSAPIAAVVAESKLPTVVIATLIRNKGHSLPYFFSSLNGLDYPKNRISLWLRSDHNSDESDDIIQTWHANASHAYHSVHLEQQIGGPAKWPEETSSIDWPVVRHSHIIESKEAALRYAKTIWADFILFIDADVFLTDPLTLQYLVGLNLPIVAPMVQSDGLYSNFWAGMTSTFYYQRTPEYKEIYEFKKVGEFSVPMIHSAVLINLRDSVTDNLTFNATKLRNLAYNQGDDFLVDDFIPQDDIIVLALSANYSKIPLIISNARVFGFILVPLNEVDDADKDLYQLVNIKLLMIQEIGQGIDVLEPLTKFVTRPYRDSLSLDKIVMVNLERRPDRLHKMESNFMELGLQVEVLPAVDGKELTDKRLQELGVKFLEGYADPYHNRPMTMGEIGCFLSHYQIWEEMVKRDLKEVLILEDDLRFETYFKQQVTNTIDEAREIGGWDLIYLGRKRLQNQDETFVSGSKKLVHPSYSYWTLAYVLSISGARKLLAAKPLEKIIPVDEFLPIMFDQHINTTWKSAFPERNLVAWSVAPLLIFPTHYTGEPGHFSDTEDSDLATTDQGFQNDSAEKKGEKENYSKPISTIIGTNQDEIINNSDLVDNLSANPVTTQSLNSIDKNEL